MHKTALHKIIILVATIALGTASVATEALARGGGGGGGHGGGFGGLHDGGLGGVCGGSIGAPHLAGGFGGRSFVGRGSTTASAGASHVMAVTAIRSRMTTDTTSGLGRVPALQQRLLAASPCARARQAAMASPLGLRLTRRSGAGRLRREM
jgi:hypothetical protein